MKPSEIRVGATYRGRKGLPRQVTEIRLPGSPGFDPRVSWAINAGKWGECFLETFAQWAIAEVKGPTQ